MARMQPQPTDAATIETTIAGIVANAVRAPGAVPDGGPLKVYRSATIALDRAEGEADGRKVTLTFSSEERVEHWFGVLILGHGDGECDMSWFQTGRAPLLMDHFSRDLVGVVESAGIGADRRGRAVVRFGKSARAEEVLQDVRDGIRANVSVGFEVNRLVLVEETEDVNVYRATSWRPLEVSLVSIPADMSVGVKSSRDEVARLLRGFDCTIDNTVHERTRTMTNTTTTTTEPPAAAAAASGISADEVERRIAAAREAEQLRISGITALAAKWNMREFGEEHIRKGTTIELFRGLMLDKIPPGRPLETPATSLDLTGRERRRYSLRVAMLGAMKRAGLIGIEIDDGFEQECTKAAAEKAQRAGLEVRGGILIPDDIQRMQIGSDMRPEDLQRALSTYNQMVAGGLLTRDQTVGTASQGGNLVATNLLASNFIDLLRNMMKVRQLGATVLDGLVGNVAIPKQTGAATAGWQAESGAQAESQAAFGQVTLSPKHINGQVDMTRQLLLQSTPAIEMLVRLDLATVVALAIDLATIHGTGASNQPTGVAATAGIGSVAGGTNGAAPTWDNIVDLESAIANANALIDAPAYLTNSKVRGKLKRTQRFASTNGDPIWELRSSYQPDGEMNGYRSAVSNQVSSTLTKGTSVGVCSAIFMGVWRDLLIGEWGTLELLPNPYSQAGAGILQMHVYQTVDVAVRRAESFAAMLDALTV